MLFHVTCCDIDNHILTTGDYIWESLQQLFSLMNLIIVLPFSCGVSLVGYLVRNNKMGLYFLSKGYVQHGLNILFHILLIKMTNCLRP